jgi:hypothetical protein
MQVITEAELIARIRSFLERHDMAPTTFGRKATGEPQIISSIEGGRSPSLKVVQRIIAFMDETDARARLHEKLSADPPPPGDREDDQLPFSKAPVSPTGDISRTSSSTSAPQRPSAVSGSSPKSSCSGDLLVSGPSAPTAAAEDKAA